ncbi:MAG: hypothetical protein ACLTG4_09405 [Oscillospiraceae bacterium]
MTIYGIATATRPIEGDYHPMEPRDFPISSRAAAHPRHVAPTVQTMQQAEENEATKLEKMLDTACPL